MKSLILTCLTALAVSACTPDTCRPGDIRASIMAARFVEQELRSPGSASFGSHNRATITDAGWCTYRVTNYVDAQNGFGATIRQRFTIEMFRRIDDNTWVARNLNFHN